MGKRKRAQRKRAQRERALGRGTDPTSSWPAPSNAHAEAAAAAPFVRARARFADGVAAYSEGRYDAAAAALDDVLDTLPTSADALCARGMVAATLDDRETAVRCLSDGLRLLGGVPDDSTAEAWNELAVSQRALGGEQNLAAAEATLRTLLERLDDHGPGWHNLALVLADLDRVDEAAAAARRASVLLPNHPGVLTLLGKQLRAQGRLSSAAAILRRAHAVAPDDSEVMTALGNVLFYLGEIDESLALFRRTCELRPDWSIAWTNIGTMLYAAQHIDESLAAHERALELEPESAQFRMRRSAALLQKGRLREGWDEYEHRLDNDPPLRRWAGTTEWNGEPVAGRVLLVYREQGIGDEIMFASCVPDLVAADVELIVETDPRVVGLFRRSFPGVTVRAQSNDCLATDDDPTPAAPDADLVVAMGSLGRHFRSDLAAFQPPTGPLRAGYLRADERLAARWSERLAQVGGAGPLVGISWRSMIRTAERRLEYSRLDEWGGILTVPGARFVLLQYDECEREVLEAERRFGVAIHRWRDLDLKDDFDGIAGLMVDLDLVIAPRNAVTMLAGSLGVPTLAIGNEGDWSECGTGQLPWFGSVECLNRNVREPWEVVLRAAAERVQRLVRGESPVDSLAPSPSVSRIV